MLSSIPQAKTGYARPKITSSQSPPPAPPRTSKAVDQNIFSSLPLQITVGALCASYWRGAWYIFDYTLFPNDLFLSGISSIGLGSSLLALQQFIFSHKYDGTKLHLRLFPRPKNASLHTMVKKTNRFVSLYVVALGCVLVWRGAWVLWDVAANYVGESTSNKGITEGSKQQQQQQQKLDKHDRAQQDVDRRLFYSGIASHLFATAGLLYIGRFMSVMAPPANTSVMTDIFIHGKGRRMAEVARSFVR